MSSNYNKPDTNKRPSHIPRKQYDIKTLLHGKSVKTSVPDRGTQSSQEILPRSQEKQADQSNKLDNSASEKRLYSQEYNEGKQLYQPSRFNKGKQPENKKQACEETFDQLLEKLRRDYICPLEKRKAEEAKRKNPPPLYLPPPTEDYYDSAFLEFVRKIVCKNSSQNIGSSMAQNHKAEDYLVTHESNRIKNFKEAPFKEPYIEEDSAPESSAEPREELNYIEKSRRIPNLRENSVEPSRRKSCMIPRELSLKENYAQPSRRKSIITPRECNLKENIIGPGRKTSIVPRESIIKDSYATQSRKKSMVRRECNIKENTVEPVQRKLSLTSRESRNISKASTLKEKFIEPLPRQASVTSIKSHPKITPLRKSPIISVNKEKNVNQLPRVSSPTGCYVEKSRREINPYKQEDPPIEDNLIDYNLDFDSIVLDDLTENAIIQSNMNEDIGESINFKKSASSNYSWLCFDTNDEFVNFKDRFDKELSNPFLGLKESMKEDETPVNPNNSEQVSNTTQENIVQELKVVHQESSNNSIDIEKHAIGTSTPKGKELSNADVKSYKRKYEETEPAAPSIFKLPSRIRRTY